MERNGDEIDEKNQIKKRMNEYAFWLPFRIQLMNAHFTVS